jgi:hypothetical protein
MRRTGAVLAALFSVVLLGCGEASEVPPGTVEEARFEGAEQVDAAAGAIPDDALERARATADDLTRDLAGMVMTTLQEQGAVAAVEVCSGVAQERTASHAREGVVVRRVTDRLRNPLNAPDAEEARELERFEVLAGEGRLPGEIVRLVRRGDDRTLHYMRPIVMGQPCLTCHGPPEEIDPEVRAILSERYPQDAATGYRLGEFRGAVSVRVDLGPEQVL